MSPESIASILLNVIRVAVEVAGALGGDPHATVRDVLEEVERADKGAVHPRADEITRRHLARVGAIKP